MNVSMNRRFPFRISLIGALSFAVLFSSFVPVYSQAKREVDESSLRYQLNRKDQHFVYFRYVDGDKYPVMFKCDPRLNKIEVVLCGTYDKVYDIVRQVQSSGDLIDLTPIRQIAKSVDFGTQHDKKFDGYREAWGGIILEAMLKSVGLLSSDGYKGDLLVDEYVGNEPHVFEVVLGSQQDFKAWKAYMLRNFELKNVSAPEAKPLLFLKLLGGNQVLDERDWEFLSTYFDVLGYDEPQVKEFFSNTKDIVLDYLDKTKEAKQVGQGFGEMLMSGIEGKTKDFKVKKLVAYFGLMIAAGVTRKVFDELIFEPLGNKVVELGNKVVGFFKPSER